MGLFSKIKKAFKKVVRGIGKVIKKVTKPFVKVAKAVLKPVGKVFGKLGFVGSLALGFMFGGGFPFLSNWFSGLEGGSFLGRFMDTVSQGFSRVMKPFKSAFKSVTEMFKQGINRVGQAFGMEGPGKMVWDTSGEFGFLKAGGSAEGAGRTLTEALGDFMQNTLNKVTGKSKRVFKGIEVPSVEVPTVGGSMPIDNLGAFGDIDPMSGTRVTQAGAGSQSLLGQNQYIDTPQYTGYSPSTPGMGGTNYVTDTGVGVTQDLSQVASEQVGGSTPILDKLDEGAEWFGKKVSGLKETTVGRGADYAFKGYSAYSAFAPGEDIEEPFYNANIGLANAGLTQVDQNNQLLSELQFSPTPTSQDTSFNTLAQNYINGFGYALPSAQTDLPYYASQLPHYGYQYGDYIMDSYS